MSIRSTVVVHEIATDGLPDMDALTGRVAFIFDGCIVSGWPLNLREDEALWEANSDVGDPAREFRGVTHWVEFPEPVWNYERGKVADEGPVKAKRTSMERAQYADLDFDVRIVRSSEEPTFAIDLTNDRVTTHSPLGTVRFAYEQAASFVAMLNRWSSSLTRVLEL